jgi:SAM-dependent methyltransferase
MCAAHDSFEIKPVIVELGSRGIGDQKNISARKVFCTDKDDYIGVDFIAGDHVDLVSDVGDLPFADKHASTIIAMNLLEHVESPHIVFDEINRLLSDDGIIIMCTPFSFVFHDCPGDYYRYTSDLYLLKFKNIRHKIVATVGNPEKPRIVYFIGSNSSQVQKNYGKFHAAFSVLYEKSLRPFSRFKSKLRSPFAPSHFRDDVKYQHTLNVRLY